MKPDRQSSEVSRVFFDILAYLADHPDAGDVVEGIVQWWLLEQRIKQQIPVVKRALAELGKKGFVLEHRDRNGRIQYRINRRKHKQIKEFLNHRLNELDCNSANGNVEKP